MHNTLQGRCEPHSFWDSLAGYTTLRPGSSGHGPIRSLGKIYEQLLTPENPLLPTAAVHELTRRQRVGLYDETFQHTIDWGLGLIINSAQYGRETVPYGYGLHASADTFGHSGAQSSSAFADPQHDLVIAWVLNGMCGEAAHRPRARALQTAIYEDLGIWGMEDRRLKTEG
jgi:CubicO group peptidase (beta-lactamase class C family)